MNNTVTIKQAEELVELGGKFYQCDGEHYFDAYSCSYQYVHSIGFVKLTDDGKLPVHPRITRNPHRMFSFSDL